MKMTTTVIGMMTGTMKNLNNKHTKENRMKTTLIALVSFVFFSSITLANVDSKLIDTSEAVTEALNHFSAQNNTNTVAIFKGIQASPNDHGVSVKVYLTNGTKIKYSCHRHTSSEPFECH